MSQPDSTTQARLIPSRINFDINDESGYPRTSMRASPARLKGGYTILPAPFSFFFDGLEFGLLAPGQHGGRGCSATMTTGLPSVPIEYAEPCREREAGAEVQLFSFKKSESLPNLPGLWVAPAGRIVALAPQTVLHFAFGQPALLNGWRGRPWSTVTRPP